METWHLLLAMSPYLLFGFGVAGILKVLIPDEYLVKHLSGRKWTSVFKAAMVGVPLPLCSCGVIPVTAHLKKSGAGRGAVISFLTSTPTSGIDSIFASYSLLGLVFALMRVLASFFIGIFAGILSNIFAAEKAMKGNNFKEDAACGATCANCSNIGVTSKIKRMLDYAYVELIDDVGGWLLIGIFAGSLISYFVPTSLVENYFNNPFISYTVMLIVGLPMYVCATGSIPIAASLILKGMNPGAGLVFLIAGPATNTATISFVGGKLGRKTLFIYLSSIILGSIGFGLLMDLVWPDLGYGIRSASNSMQMLPYWLEVSCSILLIIFILRTYVIKLFKIKKTDDFNVHIKVKDITCNHCKMSIEKALLDVAGVEEVLVDVNKKIVNIKGNPNVEQVLNRIEKIGYNPERK